MNGCHNRRCHDVVRHSALSRSVCRQCLTANSCRGERPTSPAVIPPVPPAAWRPARDRSRSVHAALRAARGGAAASARDRRGRCGELVAQLAVGKRSVHTRAGRTSDRIWGCVAEAVRPVPAGVARARRRDGGGGGPPAAAHVAAEESADDEGRHRRSMRGRPVRCRARAVQVPRKTSAARPLAAAPIMPTRPVARLGTPTWRATARRR